MPEGPEIRRAADRLAKVLVGRTIDNAVLTPHRLRRFGSRLTGTTVRAVDTRGKAMLTRFDNGLTLYSHNQLYGRWYTLRRPEMPNTKRQLRVALHTESHSALLYSASDIEVLTEKQLALHAFLGRIGPDILDEALMRDGIVERLQSKPFRNRATGSLYLDQSFLAGLGNYLRSEVLWAAGVHPESRPAELADATRDALARETLEISRRSYRTGGLTVPPDLARRLKAAGWSFSERRFQVFGREGQACHSCGETIERRTMSSRNLFWCPGCQRSPGD